MSYVTPKEIDSIAQSIADQVDQQNLTSKSHIEAYTLTGIVDTRAND